MKSKLDEKISKNRTITPLIAEIKKDLGKQADIDLKKAMGGIKDNAIQKFLTKNKKKHIKYKLFPPIFIQSKWLKKNSGK